MQIAGIRKRRPAVIARNLQPTLIRRLRFKSITAGISLDNVISSITILKQQKPIKRINIWPRNGDIKFHIESNRTVILSPDHRHSRSIVSLFIIIRLNQKRRGKQTNSDNTDDDGGRHLFNFGLGKHYASGVQTDRNKRE